MFKDNVTFDSEHLRGRGRWLWREIFGEKLCKNDNTWKLNVCMCGFWYANAVRKTMILLTWLKAIHTWSKGTVNAMTGSSSNLRGLLLPSLPRDWVVLKLSHKSFICSYIKNSKYWMFYKQIHIFPKILTWVVVR